MKDSSGTAGLSEIPPPIGWRLWCLAVRPRTLLIAVAPVVAGAGLAWGQRHGLAPLPLAAALIGALFIQMGTNLWNDVADGVRGGDPPQRLGPPRVTALGWAKADQVRHAALLCFALAALAGLYLTILGGWRILALGVASLVAGWAYSSGPKPISASPLGEVFVVAFFGVGAVAGTVWLQLHALGPAAILLGIAIGLPAAAVLTVNNVRDLDSDRLSGRRTLAILLGAERARWLYAGLVLAPFPLLLLPAAPAGAWVAWAAAPWALRLAWSFRHAQGRRHNSFLAATARLQLLLGALAAAGCVVAAGS